MLPVLLLFLQQNLFAGLSERTQQKQEQKLHTFSLRFFSQQMYLFLG